VFQLTRCAPETAGAHASTGQRPRAIVALWASLALSRLQPLFQQDADGNLERDAMPFAFAHPSIRTCDGEAR